MSRKTDVQLARLAARKRLRTVVRAEMSIMADRILNDVEDQFDQEFSRRVQAGEPYVLAPAKWDTWVREEVFTRVPQLTEGE